MVRKNFIIAGYQFEYLKREAQKRGVSMSEILRAAIDAYMAKEGK